MVKQIVYSRAALKTLARIPQNSAKLIRDKVRQYASDPASLANNVKMLQGPERLWRLRVGDWRVIFDEDGQVILVARIAPRGGAYD